MCKPRRMAVGIGFGFLMGGSGGSGGEKGIKMREAGSFGQPGQGLVLLLKK